MVENRCNTCKQTDNGQTGEHNCKECGLPQLHDKQVCDLLLETKNRREELS